jgi:hypothetical protein
LNTKEETMNLQQELMVMKPAELQECLSALEMDTTGAKSVLVMRLTQFCAPLGIKSVGELKARTKAYEKVCVKQINSNTY